MRRGVKRKGGEKELRRTSWAEVVEGSTHTFLHCGSEEVENGEPAQSAVLYTAVTMS